MMSCSDLGLPSVADFISLLHLRAMALSAFSTCGLTSPRDAELTAATSSHLHGGFVE